MRANSSIASLIVVMLTVAGGCKPADEPIVVAPVETPAIEPAPTRSPPAALDELLFQAENVRPAAQSQEELNSIGDREAGGPAQLGVAPAAPARVVDRLFYQCTDDVTFAVRIMGSKLVVFPPRYSNGYIVLDRIASDDGVHYAGSGADFRAADDLATLRVPGARYVDCVSNPAASLWQTLPR